MVCGRCAFARMRFVYTMRFQVPSARNVHTPLSSSFLSRRHVVQRADDTLQILSADLRIDLRRLRALVTEQLLDSPDIRSALE